MASFKLGVNMEVKQLKRASQYTASSHATNPSVAPVLGRSSSALQTGISQANASLRKAKFVQRALSVQVKEPVLTDAVAVTPSTPALKPIAAPSKPVWNAPSGQAAIPGLFGAPLVGRPEPMGASVDPITGAVNFVVYSSNATGMRLVLFTEQDLLAGKATAEIEISKINNKTGEVWHIMLPNMKPGLLYAYRVSGPNQKSNQPEHKGLAFDQSTVMLDPYARMVLSRRQYGQVGAPVAYKTPGVLGYASTWPQAACAVPSAQDDQDFDWEGDTPLNLPMEELVVYEMHVRGFTQHASSGVSAPGTYAGMIQKLDHLAKLGVNAVELLPVNEFNELEYYSQIPGSDPPEYRFNFWGYSTVNFFSPMSRYSANIAAGGPPRSLAHEFKSLVKECHKRGIEVILDVVFNHTAEGNERGLALSFRGLDNRTYYMLAPGGEYYNYSGCGNTFNCNHPVVRQFIVDALKFWVQEYHVDGFRFDLASIMTRAHSAWHPTQYDDMGKPLPAHASGAIIDAATGIMTDGAGVPTGTPLSDPPLIEMISEDPVLRSTKLIAEAWDCDGLNQVGAFPHYGARWAEWNGKFRDTVRNFIKGTDGWVGPFAAAICGSPDVYAHQQAPETDWWGNNGGKKWKGNRPPSASINFVTAHDGFTLADLVSYNEKHNEANGENNKDGESHNNSWNCGEEGPSNQWTVKRLRQRQMRNLTMALMLAQGVPMVTMGDEYGHTKNGNNNTYCHDNELNWFDWAAAEADPSGLNRFTRRLINFRRSRPELQRTTWVTDRDIQWHGDLANTPDWSHESRLCAFTLTDGAGNGIYCAFNTSHVPKVLKLPQWPGRVWVPVADTSKVAPFDFLQADEELSQDQVDGARAAAMMWTADHSYPVLPWSSIILESVPEACTNILKHNSNNTATAGAAGGVAAGRGRPLEETLNNLPNMI